MKNLEEAKKVNEEESKTLSETQIFKSRVYK